jgi:predicted amidohydrolase
VVCSLVSSPRRSAAHQILAEADGETESLIVADLSFDRLEEVRGKMPVATHQRYDLYNPPRSDAVRVVKGLDRK